MTAIETGSFESIDVAAVALEADALRRIPRSLALRHDVLSLFSDGNSITVALPDAADRETIDRVRFATGMHVRTVQASREAIRARLSDAYANAPHAGAAYGKGDEAPAIRELDALHSRAANARASDVHVEPCAGGGRVRQRVDGVLHEVRALPAELYAQVVSRIKLLAGMDIADRRQPQDGRYPIETSGRSIDARVSSMPTIAGEKLVIRLLDNHTRIPDLHSLGMPPELAARFTAAVHAPHGFIVVCGPTGSGKTTTLYAALAARNTPGQNLCSVEDPVEIAIPGVAQVQVNVRAGVTFASALRAFMRQDPNAIMVGEMRDEETAAVAASASLSGQLVLTTLHSNDAPRCVERLLELGVARHTLAAGLTAVIAQRLVRRLCRRCAARSAQGCEACGMTGFSGRSALFEAMFLDDKMRTAIAGGASSVQLCEMALERGYVPMPAEGLRLVRLGDTSLDELRRVLPVEEAV